MNALLRAAFSVAVLIPLAQPALAQSQSRASISAGFALPMDLGNQEIKPVGGDELTTGFLSQAAWAEGTFFPSARISLHTALDLPVWTYDTHWHHVGTAGFDAHIKRYDTVVSEAIGFRTRSAGRTQVITVVGFGLVFARTVYQSTYPQFSTSGRAPRRTVETNLNPSVLGGINLSVVVSRRVGIVARILARATHRSDRTPHFGWFNLTPAVGISIQ
jgi:hypothetical protein